MGDEKPGPTEGSGKSSGEDAGASYRKAGPYLNASWSLIGSVGLWTAVGWWLDGKLETRPWLLVTGAVLGMGLGFYLFFKQLMAIGRKRTDGK